MSATLPTFDCLILSGGGAKGAYGAGAAHALFAYYRLKDVRREVCFIGTSAGALNACTLASSDDAKLKSLWLDSVSNESVLGRRRYYVTARVVWKLLRERLPFGGRKPFAIFPSDHLRALIERNVSFGGLGGRHLIVLTTNYTSGKITAFYSSDLIEGFCADDAREPADRRRLDYYRKITDDEHFVSALLASAAIPVFFPPVVVDGDYHVDGGVGNNTPTREAAYFLRFLGEKMKGVPGEVYCVQQDPPGSASGEGGPVRFMDLLKRTADVAQYLHMAPIVKAWYRINEEVGREEAGAGAALAWLKSQGYDEATVRLVEENVIGPLSRLGGSTRRRNFTMYNVEPSSHLGDTLDFSPETTRGHLRRGYADMLKTLLDNDKINAFERDDLLDKLRV